VKRLLTAAALALTACSAGASAAYADNGDCRDIRPATATSAAVTACRQDAWLHQGTARISNTVAASESPSWNTTKPTAAFNDGGAAYVGFAPVDMVQSDPRVHPTFTGTYTGVLDNIAASFYITNVIYQKTATDPSNFYTLTIDGKTVWTNGSADDEVATPLTTVDDTTGHIDFAFTNLYDTLAAKGIANDSTTTHTITLSLINKYYGDGNFVLKYDSTEYPSGLIFNLEDDPLNNSFVVMDTTWEL